MACPRPLAILNFAIYILLLGALILTIVMAFGCIPTKAGKTSALASVYGMQVLLPGPGVHKINIASFALCVDVQGSPTCAYSLDKKASYLYPILYPHQRPSSTTLRCLQLALALQRELFGAIILLPVVFLTFALIWAVCGFGFHHQASRIYALGSTLVATFIMLADGFSVRQGISALQIATTTDLTYSRGNYWNYTIAVFCFAFWALVAQSVAVLFTSYGPDTAVIFNAEDEHELHPILSPPSV